MTIVTGLTADRMIAMENQTIIDGNVVGNNLHLQTRAGTDIDAGNVRGPMGPSGASFIVCTSTTRPSGLIPADEGKAIYETDTDLIRIWTGTRWKLQEQIICTSTTRPAMTSQDAGVTIYETDTFSQYAWTGTAWQGTGFDPGDLKQSARVTPLAGWLLCDGAEISRATYSRLFSAISTSYGTGNGSTTFNIPDFRQRTMVAAGAVAGDTNRPTTRVLGQVGGEERHLLTVAEMPSHNHTQAAHHHSLYMNVPAGGGGALAVNTTALGNMADIGYVGNATPTIDNNGGGGAHNSMPPFVVANVFIKA